MGCTASSWGRVPEPRAVPGHREVRQQVLLLELGKRTSTSLQHLFPWRCRPAVHGEAHSLGTSAAHGRASSGGMSQMVGLPFAGFIFMYRGLDKSP